MVFLLGRNVSRPWDPLLPEAVGGFLLLSIDWQVPGGFEFGNSSPNKPGEFVFLRRAGRQGRSSVLPP